MSYQNSDNNREPRYSRYKEQPIQSIIESAPDRTLLIVVTFLVIIGFMAIFSASAPKCLDGGGNPAQFLIKQVISFVVGFIGLKFFINYDYKKLAQWNTIVFIIILVLLALVDFTPLGVMVNGAKRWINIAGFQLQPSEFAKPAVVLLLASAFKNDANLFDQDKWVFAFLPIIGMILFIFMQPNLSMVILLLSVSVVMFLCAGGSLKLFFSCLIAGVTTIIIGLTTIIKPYQLTRLRTWRHPELDPQGAGYNIIQSLIAFASGGLTGVGYGGSIQIIIHAAQKSSSCEDFFAYEVQSCSFSYSLIVVSKSNGLLCHPLRSSEFPQPPVSLRCLLPLFPYDYPHAAPKVFIYFLQCCFHASYPEIVYPPSYHLIKSLYPVVHIH